jgi:glutamate dehydrogenase (NAD(P)+)
VICISCWDQSSQDAVSIRKREGVNLDELRRITDRFGSIDKEKAADLGYEVLPGDAWLSQAVDILVPAAMENQIHSGNVADINPSVKIVLEGANGPVTPEADDALGRRSVFVIPDLLANSGGVTCSYFEQVQCNMNYFWDKEEVLGKLDQKLTTSYIAISNMSKQKALPMRDAAYVIAVSRVATACRDRGWV